MKSKITVILAMLLLFALTGCNNTPQTEKMPEPFSFSESNEQTSEPDTLLATEETNEVDTTPNLCRVPSLRKWKVPQNQRVRKAVIQKSLSRLLYRRKHHYSGRKIASLRQQLRPKQKLRRLHRLFRRKRQKAYRRRKHRLSQNPSTILNLTLTLSVQN